MPAALDRVYDTEFEQPFPRSFPKLIMDLTLSAHYRTRRTMRSLFATLLVAILFFAPEAIAQDSKAHPDMSFFITSAGPGNGANLGGLEGADDFCTLLAEAAGSEGKEWAAYLSAAPTEDSEAINARDRIGSGPWYNSKGVLIATTVDELHSDKANLTKEASIDELGNMVNGRGDSPNTHDILTGASLEGLFVPGDTDTTCNNWTNSDEGSALVGHHDRQGGGTNPTSWNSAHPSRGCSQSNLQASGGNGLYYCFAKK